jgi:DNA-directed RNA polymerase subunit M/transcription elongation factor TFIIS
MDTPEETIRKQQFVKLILCASNYKRFAQFPQFLKNKLITLLEYQIYTTSSVIMFVEDDYADNSYFVNVNIDPKSSCNHTYLISGLCNYALYKFVLKERLPDSCKKIIKDNLFMIKIRDIFKQNPLKFNMNINGRYFDDIEIRKNQIIAKKTSQQYRCAACGARETTYEVKQLRCLDEGSTQIITCVPCGNIWRIS